MKALMKSLAVAVTSTFLAVAVSLTAIHQTVWRFQTPSTLPAEASIVKVTNVFGSCSGVVVSPAIVLTAAHCDGPEMKVNGKDAVVIKKDPTRDIMVLGSVGTNRPWAKWATGMPDYETKVFMIGYPVGLTMVVKEGKFIDFAFGEDVPTNMTGDMVINGQVEGGFSGGGVFIYEDGEFKLVGIINAGTRTMVLVSGMDQVYEFLKDVK